MYKRNYPGRIIWFRRASTRLQSVPPILGVGEVRFQPQINEALKAKRWSIRGRLFQMMFGDVILLAPKPSSCLVRG
jgi:hypothetical protein